MVRNCPKGLGNPVFDKLEAELAKAMLSLPATKVRQESKFAHTCRFTVQSQRLACSRHVAYLEADHPLCVHTSLLLSRRALRLAAALQAPR